MKSKDRIRITTNLERELLEAFKEIADEEGRHLNYYIEKGLKIILREYERSDTKSEEREFNNKKI